MTVFVRWGPIAAKFQDLAMLMAPGQVTPTNPNKVESMLYSAKMDGLLMRDHFYVRAEKPAKAEPFANRSAAFTSPATYVYAAGQVGLFIDSMKQSLEAMEKSPQGAALSKELATKGLKLNDLFTTFGPEITILSDWESGALAVPTLFAAVEIRDSAKARLFADLLMSEMGDEKKLAMSEEDGTKLWMLPNQMPAVQPTVALNDKHLIFGLNPQTVKGALKRARAGDADVPSRSDYQSALKTVSAPNAGVLYLDMKTLFERSYDKMKPMAAFSMLGQPDLAKYFDPAKLPKAETISRHLLPVFISWAEADKGMQMESTGSLSLIQTYIPLVATATFALFPRFSVPPSPPATTSPPAPPVKR
jgi:hypothetical protein